MKSVRKICKALSNVMFVLVIVLLIAVTVLTLLSHVNMRQDRLLFGSFGFGRVVTGSMEPEIPTGSFVFVLRTDPAQLKVGDVIMFHSDDPSIPDNTPVSHKIVRTEVDQNGVLTYITKGTANSIEDSYPVYFDDIIGVVVYSSSFIGSIIGLAQSPYVYPALIVLLLLSMLQSIVDIFKQARFLKNDTTV